MSTGKWKKEGRRVQPPLWNTEHEMIFLDGLGTHSFSRMSRLEMLKNYLKAMGLPGVMKGMDKKFLKTYVINSIAVEKANPTHKTSRRINVDELLDTNESNHTSED